MGRIAGKQAVALLGGEGKATGKVIELQGDAGGKVMMDRHDGFHEIVGKESGVKIVGIDGLSEAVKAIVDGKYSATVFNDSTKLGSIVVDTALKVAKGEQVPEMAARA